MPPAVTQNISAGEELLTAVRLYGSGLGQPQLLDDGASDFFHLPLLALQQGLERWVKICLCFHHLEQHGEFPNESHFKSGKQSHNIQPLLDQLIVLAYSPGFEAKFPYVKQDRVFLKSKLFRAYLRSLSTFGVSSRYFHLNTVLGVVTDFNPPERAWQDIEQTVLDYNPKLKQAFEASGGAPEMVVQMLAESRSILIRCGRALARLLVLGALGAEAKRHTRHVYDFLQLSDEDLLTAKFKAFHKDL